MVGDDGGSGLSVCIHLIYFFCCFSCAGLIIVARFFVDLSACRVSLEIQDLSTRNPKHGPSLPSLPSFPLSYRLETMEINRWREAGGNSPPPPKRISDSDSIAYYIDIDIYLSSPAMKGSRSMAAFINQRRNGVSY